MGKFLEAEKLRQAEFRASSPSISAALRADGIYKGRARPFCLPRCCQFHALENLYPGIRVSAPAHFLHHDIKWHDGGKGQPSNHLCDSQVCCVNFLFPFSEQPRALAEVLRPFYPTLGCMLPIEDGKYVTHEWIGRENYLGELSRNGLRTRGALYTSADAAVMFERNDGKRQIVLIEWKYTESYYGTPLRIARSGTDRLKIYLPLLERDDCPIDKRYLTCWDPLFYNPFDQLMRQQLLAHEMERAQELGADLVSVLHIAPEANLDFRRVTSDRLGALGETAMGVWSKLVRHQDRFQSISTEKLFGGLSSKSLPEMAGWLEYIHERYAWVKEAPATR